MTEWADLFVARQRVALATMCKIESQFESTEPVVKVTWGWLSAAGQTSAMLCADGKAARTSRWNPFTRQAISVVWDFAEAGVFGSQAGDFLITLESMLRTIERLSPMSAIGQVGQADACKSKLPSEVAQVWFTDPPYYDAIPYSDLSDFFFVWLKRALPDGTTDSGHRRVEQSTNPQTRRNRSRRNENLCGTTKRQFLLRGCNGPRLRRRTACR